MPQRFTLSDWANISEIVAAIGVIASLIFVGLELRDNTSATEAATRQAINQKDINYLSLSLDSSVLAVASAKIEQGEELTPLERSQLIQREYVNFISFEKSYYQFTKGMLDESEWQRHREIARYVIQNSQFAREMWKRNGGGFTPEFRNVMDELMKEVGSN